MPYQGSSFYDNSAVFDTYTKLRERTESANDTLEAPVIWQLLNDAGGVRGHDFLDLGCGNAAFGKDLLAAGAASYLGLDGSANMVAEAEKTLQGTPGRVLRAELQDWSYPANSSSRVCARLVLHYVEGLEALLRQIHRTLQPGGLLVYSVEHPVLTAREMALDDGPDGAWVVDDYFNTGPRITDWLGAKVVKYHRTVEDHFQALQKSGFVVETLRESKPVRSNFETEETFLRRQRVPLFLFMGARKVA
ncbi:MAG: class I SAM-dependent methyltransferase [Pseudomonadota bacterium]